MPVSPGSTDTSPGTGGWRRSLPVLVGAVHVGVADDELVGDRVVVAHDELDQRALVDAEVADGEPAVLDAELDSHHARARARLPAVGGGVDRVGGAGDARADQRGEGQADDTLAALMPAAPPPVRRRS